MKIALAVLVALTTAEAGDRIPSQPLTDPEVEYAIRQGARLRGGLYLSDTGQGFLNAMSAANNDPTGSTGFSVRVHTPTTLIATDADDAKRAYLEYSLNDVTNDDRQPVLRVRADPDEPTEVTAQGMVGTSGVRHVVLLDTKKRRSSAIQPLSTGTYSQTSQNAMGASIELVGLEVIFSLQDVHTLRCADKKGEFRVNVIGSTNEEKSFKIKTKHFDNLGWPKKFSCN